MATILVRVPAVQTRGLVSQNLLGNGRCAAAEGPLKIAALLNMISGRRKRVLFRRFFKGSQVTTVAGPALSFYGSFFTSPDVYRIRAMIICGPSNSTSTTVIPKFNFRLQEWKTGSPGLAYNCPTIHVARRKTGTIPPDDLMVFEQVWSIEDIRTDVGGNFIFERTKYDFIISHQGHVRIFGVIIFEEPHDTVRLNAESLDLFATAGPTNLITGAPITTAAVKGLLDASTRLWKFAGPNLINVNHWDAAGYTTGSGTFQNIYDTSITAWSATAPGHWVPSHRKGTLRSKAVPCLIRANLSENAQVRILREAGTWITLSGPVGGGWVEGVANLDSTITSEKLDIHYKSTDLLSAAVHQVQIYEYQDSDGDPDTPLSISGCVGWWRADDPRIVTSSGKVSSWPDKTEYGRDLSQATDARRPSLVSNVIGGQPVVRFGSTSDDHFLNWDGSAAPEIATVYAVIKMETSASYQLLARLGSGAGVNLYLGGNGADFAVDRPACYSAGPRAVWSAALVNGTNYLVKWRYDITGGANEDYATQVNAGTEVTGSSAEAISPGTFLSIGLDPGVSNSQDLVSDVAEIAVYNRQLTAAEEAKFRSYVSGRYGISM